MFNGFRFMARLKALFVQNSADRALDDEMTAHLELLAERFERQGMDPQQAIRAAQRQFGNPSLLKQRHRESRTTMFFANVARDMRYGVRQLMKAPVFTLVCVLTLALGVGANTAVFSVMHAVLMKMLPAHDPQRLVVLHAEHRPRGVNDTGNGSTSLSYEIYQQLSARKDTFSDVMAYVPMAFSGKTAVRIDGAPEEAVGDMVSGNYFSGLGIAMQRGRGFSSGDEQQHASVAVISAKYWNTRFSRDPNVAGKTIYVKGIPFTIVGVAAEGFEGSEGGHSLDLWIPLQDRPELNAWGTAIGKSGKNYIHAPSWWCIQIMARLAPGITQQQALAQALPTFQRAALIGVEDQKQYGQPAPALSFTAAKQFGDRGDGENKSLQTLMVMVVLVLAIAISNIVMLLLARSAGRQREFSIRLAIGAGRGELARQLLVEGLLLVAAGGVAAWVLANVATRALGTWARIDASLQPDQTVLWFTLGLLLVTALVFGVAPLRSALANRPEMALKSSAAATSTGAQKVRVGNAIIVSQIAFCVVLLVAAGLLIGTLRNLLNTPLGMKSDGLVVFGVHPKHFNSVPESVTFYRALQDRLSTLPGVTAVSMVENRPGSGWSNNNGGFVIDGKSPHNLPLDETRFRNNGVGSNYFHTMGVDVIEGRDFTDADTATSPKVIIVNETFVKKYLEPGNAVGHVLSDPDGKESLTIVGVVRDHKYTSITEEPIPMLWGQFAQGGPEGELNYEVRVQGDPMSVVEPARKIAAQMDPDMPLLLPQRQTLQFEQSISQQVMFARLAGCFGVLAIVLIATGLYGTLAYRVSRRSAEIGVRMALGAQRVQVVWMVLRGSLLLTAIGVAIGIPMAFAAGRGLESSLYGVKPVDLASYGVAVVVVAMVALTASAIPARRAAGIDPATALRSE